MDLHQRSVSACLSNDAAAVTIMVLVPMRLRSLNARLAAPCPSRIRYFVIDRRLRAFICFVWLYPVNCRCARSCRACVLACRSGSRPACIPRSASLPRPHWIFLLIRRQSSTAINTQPHPGLYTLCPPARLLVTRIFSLACLNQVAPGRSCSRGGATKLLVMYFNHQSVGQ
jgi:hypothetical protein